ncbi:hypothetical protein [Roseovarius aestuarii]|uniref:hypothetical protein n=1 Tax=Roseovarius aestuarii TaxID=475083 RepID=UPI001592BB81|nr:hypothetical protein [Roseovarius aestuarii]
MVEISYQEQQDSGNRLAISANDAPRPQECSECYSRKGIKDRLSKTAFNEEFTSAFRTSFQGWVVPETGRSIFDQTCHASANMVNGSIGRKQTLACGPIGRSWDTMSSKT